MPRRFLSFLKYWRREPPTMYSKIHFVSDQSQTFRLFTGNDVERLLGGADRVEFDEVGVIALFHNLSLAKECF